MQRINVACIIKDHLHTFAEDDPGRPRRRALLWFLLPVLAAAATLAITHPLVREGAKSIVYVCLALAFGVTNGLFHLLRLSASPSLRGSHAQQRGELLRAAHANLSFALLFAVFTAAASLLYFLVAHAARSALPRMVSSFIVYAMAAALIQALVAYLYRLHLLIAAELQLE